MSEPTMIGLHHSGRIPSGTRLSDLYEIDGHIGTGGMGEVYRGHAIETGDEVAIKTIRPEMAQNPAALSLFRKEASALHNLYHQAIVRYFVFTVDRTLGLPYLAMEYVAGELLSDLIARGPLAFDDLRVLQVRLADGMQAAHDLGIVHRDVSPDNVILTDGQLRRAKIIDFGIARSPLGEGTVIGDGFAGKLSYVSPEQLGLFGGDVTGRSDIYSLGLVLAEASLGRRLDMGQNHAEVIERRRAVPDLTAIDSRIRPLIRSMLQPDPKDRPASMAEVAAWIPVGLPTKAPSRKRLAAFAAAALIVLLGGGAFFALPGLIGSDPLSIPTGPALSELAPGPPIVTLPPYSPPAAEPTETAPPPPVPAPTTSPSGPLAGRPASVPAPAPSTNSGPGTPPLPVSSSANPPPPAPLTPVPDIAGHASAPPPVALPSVDSVRPPGTRQPATEAPPVQLAAPALPASPAQPAPPRPPTMERVASYVRDYRGGSCFYLSPISISAREAMIEGLGSTPAPFVQFDTAFHEALGFDPTIQLRQINAQQCAVVDAMAVQAGQRSARVPKLRITPDLLRSGDELSGVVDVWPDAHLDLILVGDDGLAYTVSSYAKRTGKSATFRLRIEGTGARGEAKPQLVIAVAGSGSLPSLSKARGVPAERLFRDIQAEISRAGSDTALAVRYFKLMP